MAKTYLYKVYDSTGTSLITTWNDVISDPSYSLEINNPATQMPVTLARPYNNFGEGIDVAFNNQVQIYAIDKEAPNSRAIFIGYIADYKPIVGSSERVEITLFSYGSQLTNYEIESGESDALSQTTTNNAFTFSSLTTYKVAEVIKATSINPISRITLTINLYDHTFYDNVTVTLNLYSGNTPGSGTLLGTASAFLSGAAAEAASVVNFAFASNVAVSTGSYYWFEVYTDSTAGGGPQVAQVASNTAGGYSDGNAWSRTSSGSYIVTTSNLWFHVYTDGGSTTAPYLSQDPSAILTDIIDNFHANGGRVTHNNTIDSTSTVVSYTFITNTVAEGGQKVLELAPKDWYQYVDPATNLIHFHNIASATTHRFVLGKDFTSIEFDKRTEDIVNIIYFTGGSGLFVKYANPDSIAAYGQKLLNYSDQRVTVRATADTIASTILDNKSQPEVRVTAEIVDSNIIDGGYDIESVQIGDLAEFKGIDSQTGALWDVASWDSSSWDSNYSHINTLLLQIVRKEYQPGKLNIYCSTVPPDVNKRIEDINRNLNAAITVNNPSTYLT